MKFGFAAAADATWRASDIQGFDERDLGLAAASDGQIRARELRANGAGTIHRWPVAETAVFLFLYVIEGEIAFTMTDQTIVTVMRHEVVHLPFLSNVAQAAYSADFLAAELAAPGDRSTSELVPLLQMPRKTRTGDWEAAVTRNRPELFIPGNGPRAFFTYRDLGTAALTDRRIQIHDGDGAKQPMAGGTGWHDHTMSQFFMLLDGEATISVDGQGEFHMVVGDAMMLGAGMRHNVSSYSEGYNVFEVCFPADYETTARPAP